MSKEFHDSLQAGIGHIGAASEALQRAAMLCEEALAAFSMATQGSSQPEVNKARHGFLTAGSDILEKGGVVAFAASTFTSYAANLYPEQEPIALAPATQAQVDHDSNELRPGALLSEDTYQTFPTTLQTTGRNNTMRVEVPGGYADLSVYQHTPHGSEVTIDYMEVDSGQQQGKGTYLMATAAREASLRGVENFSGHYVSPYALRALAKVVGQENIIIKPSPGSHTYLEASDYVTAIDGLHKQEAAQSKGVKGVKARVDLRKRAVQSRLFGK